MSNYLKIETLNLLSLNEQEKIVRTRESNAIAAIKQEALQANIDINKARIEDLLGRKLKPADLERLEMKARIMYAYKLEGGGDEIDQLLEDYKGHAKEDVYRIGDETTEEGSDANKIAKHYLMEQLRIGDFRIIGTPETSSRYEEITGEHGSNAKITGYGGLSDVDLVNNLKARALVLVSNHEGKETQVPIETPNLLLEPGQKDVMMSLMESQGNIDGVVMEMTRRNIWDFEKDNLNGNQRNTTSNQLLLYNNSYYTEDDKLSHDVKTANAEYNATRIFLDYLRGSKKYRKHFTAMDASRQEALVRIQKGESVTLDGNT